MELFVRLLITPLSVLLPSLSHSIRACAHRDRTLSLGLAAFCNEAPAEHYCEVRNYSVFERKGNTAIEIHHQLTEVYGESCMDIKNIQEWCREFAFGRTEIHDEKRSRRLSTCNETVVKVEETMNKNLRVSLDDIFVSIYEVSRTAVYRILKLCARWFPEMLTEDHKWQRVDSGH